MGTNLGTNYHAPSLTQIPSKGNKWYVVVTKPPELQKSSKNKQIRRCTGTTDKNLAETRLPEIATKIYHEFDALLRAQSTGVDTLQIKYASPEETATILRNDPWAAIRPLSPYEQPKDPAHTLARFIRSYEAHLHKNEIGDLKERKTKITVCNQFLNVTGNLHLGEIRKFHAYQFAQWLADGGKANSTIKSKISRISKMLIHAEQQGVIDDNPFVNLSLSEYGAAKVPYLPFTPDEMKEIFAQKIPTHDRLALTLLATTGARLDEIALLKWSQVKVEHSITFLDLRTEAKVKTQQSKRVIPIHSKVAPMLSKPSKGRLFEYSIDVNGKAQNAAGKRLSQYIDNIVEHPLKVLHSFRGTFKDMLNDAGVLPTMVEQLEAGEVALQDIAATINAGRVSKDLNDRLTGHVQPDVAGRYGLGPALIPRAAAVELLALEFLPNTSN